MKTAEEYNEISNKVIAAAIEVHRQLGSGLLERVYEAALAYELNQMGLHCLRQQPVPVRYKGVFLEEEAFKMDLLVENSVIVELKTVPQLQPIHSHQLKTYLRLTNLHLGLLMNFNVMMLKDGLVRVVNNFPGTLNEKISYLNLIIILRTKIF
ncbi:MAG: GxxExxY protein [Verrucomicrobia bacterium]|nr:MAG: GxxExxY protein [Verrucomicrobiota bacterium]